MSGFTYQYLFRFRQVIVAHFTFMKFDNQNRHMQVLKAQWQLQKRAKQGTLAKLMVRCECCVPIRAEPIALPLV